MRPGYSKVIIVDWCVPQIGADFFMTSMDLTMMVTLGGEERSLEQHREYIEGAGLKIVQVFDPRDGRSEAAIECELA